MYYSPRRSGYPRKMSSNAPSPGHSSAEEYEDDTNVPDEGRWSPQAQQDADPTLPPMESGVVSSTQGPKNPTPMQKRRRVTRACDECRRKKIKCDGKQPCTHCTVYSYGWSSASIFSRGTGDPAFETTTLTRGQIAPTTNLQTEGGTLRLSTLRRSRIASIVPRLC